MKIAESGPAGGTHGGSGLFTWLPGELGPRPARLGATLRITLAGLIVVVAMLAFRMPFLAIGPYLVFLISQRDAMLVRAAAGLGLVVAPVAFGIFWMVAALSWDMPWLRIGLWAAVFFSGFYLMHVLAEPRIVLGPLAVIALMAYTLDSVPDPNLVISQLGWLWALLGLTIGSTLLVGWLLGAPSGREVLRRQMNDAYAALESLATAMAEGHRLAPNPVLGEEELDDARERARKLGLLRQLGPEEVACCLALLDAAGDAATALTRMDRAEGPAMADRLRAVAGLAGEVRRAALGLPAASDGTCGTYEVAGILLRAREIAIGARPAPAVGRAERLLAADWRTNPAHLDFAMRATAATMACYIFMTLADWNGIHTCMITCAVTALPATGTMAHKQNLRLAGAALGGMLGLFSVIFLIPQWDSLGGLLVVFSLGTALAAWVASGSERISYAGWQIALAFSITLLQDPHPVTKLDPIRDRLAGIALGIFAMRAAFVWLAPGPSRRNAPATA